MNALVTTVARWMDVRPPEYRTFSLSVLASFCVVSFSVASRALREAFFLDEFSISSLPLIALVTSALSLPSVLAFSRLLARHDPGRVYRAVVLAFIAAVMGLWAATTFLVGDTLVRATTIGFYIVTAVGTLLLTSGFWVVTSEYFQLRDAKRLFGMVAGGGTAGAMLAGLAVGPLGARVGNSGLVLSLVAVLTVLLVLQRALPNSRLGAPTTDEPALGFGEAFELVRASPHLRTMAAIVGLATVASFLVDFQFKEAASLAYPDDGDLAAFLGRFYGLTGVLSLLLQLFVAARLLSGGGIAWSLAVLPIAVLGGSLGLLVIPGLVAATTVRAADNALRKSVHRSVLEYLYVPVPSIVRRKTKTFIDSFVDSSAEGIAAVATAVWVTFLALPTRALGLAVIPLCIALLLLARSMGRQYFSTLVTRLQEEQEDIEESLVQTQFVGGEVTMSIAALDLSDAITNTGVDIRPEVLARPTGERAPRTTLDRLESPDPAVVSDTLDNADDWSDEHVGVLIRLLARDAFYRRAGAILASLPEPPIARLERLLVDEGSDFVIRRRIPGVLAQIDSEAADRALKRGLETQRFEVRYRTAVALAKRRKLDRLQITTDLRETVWTAVHREVSRERPIWELQKLLDDQPMRDDFVSGKVYGRGELSLEHTFRLLSLVLDPEPVRTAFHGIVLDDEHLRSISLEYLEQVLPSDVRDRLWPFIGDISDDQRRRSIRDMDDVVADLLKTGATLFAGEGDRARLRRALEDEGDFDA